MWTSIDAVGFTSPRARGVGGVKRRGDLRVYWMMESLMTNEDRTSSEPRAPTEELESTERGVRWKGPLLLLILAAAVTAYFTLPVEQYADDVLRWVQGLGAWSYAAFFLLYIFVAVVLIPASVLTIGAGFLYGTLWGTLIVSVSSTAGAAVAFLLGRTVAQDWAEERVEDFPRFHALYRAIERDEFKVVLLARLVPVIPFNILNYAFSLTRVSFKKYVFASWIGMLPATIVYVYVGAAAKNLTRVAAGEIDVGWLQISLFVLAGVAAISMTWLLMRRAREEFDKITREAQRESEEVPDGRT